MSLNQSLSSFKEQVADLLAEMNQDAHATIMRWQDEKPSLESLIQSLNATSEILKSQRKNAGIELEAKLKQLSKHQSIKPQPQPAADETRQSQKVEDLESKLVELNNRLLVIDEQLKDVTDEMSSSTSRPEESEIRSTKLIILQDTRRLLNEEVSTLRSDIVRLEAESKLQTERKAAEESGFVQIARLDDHLAKIAARLDKAKIQLLFPEAKGWRFSGGGSGVYFAAKDLFISEISGRFDIDLLPKETKPGTTKGGNNNCVKFAINLRGASGEDRNEAPGAKQSKPATPLRPTNSFDVSSSTDAASKNSSSSDVKKLQPVSSIGGSLSVEGAGTNIQDTSKERNSSDSGQSKSKIASTTSAQQGRTTSGGGGGSSLGAFGSSSGSMAAAAAAAMAAAAAAEGKARLPPVAPLPTQSKSGGGAPLKSEGFVSSFFSGMTKKKEKERAKAPEAESIPDDLEAKVKESTSYSGGGGGGGRISKLARAIARKADKITDKIMLRSSSSRKQSQGGSIQAPGAPPALSISANGRGSVDDPSAHRRSLSSSSSSSAQASSSAPESLPDSNLIPRPQAPPDAHLKVDIPKPQESSSSSAIANGRDEPTEKQHHARRSSGGGGGPEPQSPSTGLSLGLQEFEARPTRKGAYIQLLADTVELIGENGTHVPDVSMRELLFEVEVAMQLVLEWSPVTGWRAPERVNLTIVTLNHKMRGSSFPLPSSALRALLNLYLPRVLTNAIVASLPTEMGQYVHESKESIRMGGEIRILGQHLSTFVAPLASSTGPAASSQKIAGSLEGSPSLKARALLGLSESQAEAIAALFQHLAIPLSPSLTSSSSSSPASVISLCELCRFYDQRSKSGLWGALCAIMNRALQVCFQFMKVKETFSFVKFMDSSVSRMAKKPLRVLLTVDRLSMALDVEVGLASIRDYLDRTTREIHKLAAKSVSSSSTLPSVSLPKQSLEDQLSGLAAWYSHSSSFARQFKSKFKSLGCTILASGDSEDFQVGVEQLHYDGPLRIKIPLEVILDSEGSFIWDIKLPAVKSPAVAGSSSSVTGVLGEMLFALAEGGVGGKAETKDDVGGGDREEDASSLLSSSTSLLRTGLYQHLAATSKQQEERQGQGQSTKDPILATGSGTTQTDADSPAAAPTVGQLTLRKVLLALKLDEERLAEILTDLSSRSVSKEGVANLGSLLGSAIGCFGDMFSASLDVGWPSQADAKTGSFPPKCMLTVQNNDVSRVRADVESLMFQSALSPKVTVSTLYTIFTGLMLNYYAMDSWEMRWHHKLWSQLHEYLGKESLDVTACLSAIMEVVAPPPLSSKQSGLPTESKLRINITGGSSRQDISHLHPIFIMNDLSQRQVLESYGLATNPM